MLLHGCSDASAASGIRSAPRIPASEQNGSSRHVLVLLYSSSSRINEQNSGLLIYGRVGPVAGFLVAIQAATSCASVMAWPTARNGAYGRPWFLRPSMSAGRTPRLQRLQAGIAASRTGASPAQVYGRYTTGTSSVHDRYVTGSVRPGPLGGTRNPCGRYSTAGSLNTPHPCQRRSPRRRPISRPGGDAHPVTTSVTARQGCRGLIRLQRTRKTSRLLSADRTAEYRPTRDARQYQSRRAAQRPHKGTKRAWIGKASGYTHR